MQRQTIRHDYKLILMQRRTIRCDYKRIFVQRQTIRHDYKLILMQRQTIRQQSYDASHTRNGRGGACVPARTSAQRRFHA